MESVGIENVPVIRAFMDVFPEELLGLPPGREIEFCIDIVPGKNPISLLSYRMAQQN